MEQLINDKAKYNGVVDGSLSDAHFNSIMKRLKKEKTVGCKKVDRVVIDVITNIQVAKVGSVNLFQNLAIVVVNGGFYCVNYDKNIPSGDEILRCVVNMESSSRCIHSVDADRVIDAVEWYKNRKGLNLNPYTVLYTHCAMQGFDLIEKGYLE